jgi:hypothetical protein
MPCFAIASRKSAGRDLVARIQHVDAFRRSHINQHATGIDRADFVDANFGEAVAGRNFIRGEAVVVTVVDALMGEHVELRSHLSDLRDHQLLVGVALVAAHRAARSLCMDVKAARAEQGHVHR